MSNTLLIIDGDNLAHRAYHSSPKTITGAHGTVINAIVGFFSMLSRIWAEERPDRIFVAWDTLGVDTYRSELWPPYQSGRVFEREIVLQLDMLPTICEAFTFGVGKAAGFEADDFMASAARLQVQEGGTCLLLTTDRDSYQLVSPEVTVLVPQRGTRDLRRVGPSQVVAELGVLPEQVPDFKALSGDSSDKIPGIRGIGPKTAADLLLKHASLENVMAAWSRPEDVELALRFREAVRMRMDAPVCLPSSAPNWRTGAEALKLLGAVNLADRILAINDEQ